jgi:hypothetical protein
MTIIWTLDHKMRNICILKAANHRDSLPCERVMGISHYNFKRLCLGSMSRA